MRRVADKVPLTGDSSKRYQMIGIPDGLGARERRDGGAILFMNHELWMYVGRKGRTGTPLARNGLDNGKLYVFVIDGVADEGQFTGGTQSGRWVEIPGAEGKSEAELEAAADAVGAFGFIRVEDGASGNPGELYFVTTGGDTAISPDNIDVSKRYLMIQEDGTAESRLVMGSKGRDGSIWRYDLKNGFARERVAQLDPPGRDGVPVGPGVWESSGIIDAGSMFGKDSWVTDVQAHPPTAAPTPNTVEDGQLLLMQPNGNGHGGGHGK